MLGLGAYGKISTYFSFKGGFKVLTRYVTAVALKLIVFIALLMFVPQGYNYEGNIFTLGVASICLVVLTSLAIPIVQKVTFLVNILTLGGVAVFIRLISMGVVIVILISIGFTATGIGYWLLIAFLFTVI